MHLTWQAEDILRAVRGQCLHEQSWTAEGVSIDGRTARNGDLFVALKGPVHDAHDFVAQAFASGAVAAIVQRAPSQVPPDAPLIYVDDTFAALQDLGRVGRQRAKGKIIAVTGSVGKTGSKEQLRTMLEACGDTYANEGSFNNHWGVPLSLARLPADARFGVFEIGMDHAGEMRALGHEVKPNIALITNIEPVHLANFASTEAIADAKAEIFLGMDAGGAAILNRDNQHYSRLLAAAKTQGLKRIVSFGRDAKADARMLDYTTTETGSMTRASIMGHTVRYRLDVAGEHIAFNAMGTLLTAVLAGGDLDVCAAALENYRIPQGRGARRAVTLPDGGEFTIIDESYNASPAAVRAAIKALGQTAVGSGGRRMAALGDMKELGPTEVELHTALAQDLIDNKIDTVHCCGELMTHLYNSIPPAMRGHLAENSRELARLVADDIRGGDVIMVKGSHYSMRMERVVETLETLGDENGGRRKLAG